MWRTNPLSMDTLSQTGPLACFGMREGCHRLKYTGAIDPYIQTRTP